jgi:hypothetical protein
VSDMVWLDLAQRTWIGTFVSARLLRIDGQDEPVERAVVVGFPGPRTLYWACWLPHHCIRPSSRERGSDD